MDDWADWEDDDVVELTDEAWEIEDGRRLDTDQNRS